MKALTTSLAFAALFSTALVGLLIGCNKAENLPLKQSSSKIGNDNYYFDITKPGMKPEKTNIKKSNLRTSNGLQYLLLGNDQECTNTSGFLNLTARVMNVSDDIKYNVQIGIYLQQELSLVVPTGVPLDGPYSWGSLGIPYYVWNVGTLEPWSINNFLN